MPFIRPFNPTPPDAHDRTPAVPSRTSTQDLPMTSSPAEERGNKPSPFAMIKKWNRASSQLQSLFQLDRPSSVLLSDSDSASRGSASVPESGMLSRTPSQSTTSDLQHKTPGFISALRQNLEDKKAKKKARKELKELHDRFFVLQQESLSDPRPSTALLIQEGYGKYLAADSEPERARLKLRAEILSDLNNALARQIASNRAQQATSGGFDVNELIAELTELKARMVTPAVDAESAVKAEEAGRNGQQPPSEYDSTVETPGTPVATRSEETFVKIDGGVNAAELAKALESISIVAQFKELEGAALQELLERIRKID